MEIFQRGQLNTESRAVFLFADHKNRFTFQFNEICEEEGKNTTHSVHVIEMALGCLEMFRAHVTRQE